MRRAAARAAIDAALFDLVAQERGVYGTGHHRDLRQFIEGERLACGTHRHLLTAGFDQAELASQCAELQDIGLAETDIAIAKFLGLALAIGQAGAAEIKRQHLRIGIGSGGQDGMQAGAAAGHQDRGEHER